MGCKCIPLYPTNKKDLIIFSKYNKNMTKINENMFKIDFRVKTFIIK